MKITEPYSPTPRAKARAKPVRPAGSSPGNSTRLIVWKRLAPSVAAASSTSLSISSMIGCTVLTTNGRPTKISATTMPDGVKAILSPSGSMNWPIQPLPA
ncbi:hypothetical protein D9M72_599220 [compost metagenome]